MYTAPALEGSTLKVLHLGRFWPYLQILDQPAKGSPGTNAPAYLASYLVLKKICFIGLTLGDFVIKPFRCSTLG